MSIMREEISRTLIPTKELFESQPEWIEKRDRAVKKLFNGNLNEFNQFLSKIDPVTEWKDAMDIIDAEIAKRKVRPDGKEITGLTDVLFKRYFPSY
ncbi:hypothetical protein F9K33_04010 [bacterium]|nr:MAG: hypothetical protein F9K33_04010 [bacterium]MBL7961872.1 hypothetical protein [bacterium]MBL7996598.1 hypothetical protein [bacterium]